MSEEAIVRLEGITKSFGEVAALDGCDFLVKKGEIHGLLGENGAGKSTLMNVLYGLYQPDSGSIFINNKEVNIRSPYDSICNGIGMVHQLSTLVPDFNAVENIILSSRDRGLSFSPDKETKKIQTLAKEFGFTFPLNVKVRELPAGIKQKIEIVRSLYRNYPDVGIIPIILIYFLSRLSDF